MGSYMDRGHERRQHQPPAPAGVRGPGTFPPGSSTTLAVKGWLGLYIEAALGVPEMKPMAGMPPGGEDREDPDV